MITNYKALWHDLLHYLEEKQHEIDQQITHTDRADYRSCEAFTQGRVYTAIQQAMIQMEKDAL